MAAVAARAQVRERKAKLRTLLDWNLVIGVQVSSAASERDTQLFENDVLRRESDTRFATHPHVLRLPATIDTAPLVTRETLDAQALVLRAVPALRCLAARIDLGLLVLMLRATRRAAGLDELRATTGIRTRTLGKGGHSMLSFIPSSLRQV